MRVFTAQFGLAVASLALVGILADTAEGGPFRRRSKANNCNTCGTAAYATPVAAQGCGGCGSTSGYYGVNGTAYSMPGYQNGGVTQAGYIPPAGVPNILPARATEVKARMIDGMFEPGTITITAGTTVRWTNEGKHLHTVTSMKGDWTSGELAPGQDFTATFTQPGTFEYYCKNHKDAKEMKGTIIVK